MRGRWFFVGALIAITGGHLVYRQLRQSGPSEIAIRQTPFAIGEVVIGEGDGAPDWGPCQILVFFRPDCPFCNSAADSERDRPDLVLRRTWITETEREATEFRGRPDPASRLLWSGDAGAEFGVRGVPVAFLIEGGQAVRHWIYKGDESDAQLAAECEGAGPAP